MGRKTRRKVPSPRRDVCARRGSFATVRNLVADSAKNKQFSAERAGFEPAAGF
jgi:hypothetical protein